MTDLKRMILMHAADQHHVVHRKQVMLSAVLICFGVGLMPAQFDTKTTALKLKLCTVTLIIDIEP